MNAMDACGRNEMSGRDARRRGPVGVVAGVAFTALLLGACSASGSSGAPGSPDPAASGALTRGTVVADDGPAQEGGRLVVGLVAETNGWNPYQGQWSASSFAVANAIFDPLAALDPNGDIAPYLAESFTPSSDFTEWRIKVRSGVVFHDGTSFDASAVKANLDFGRKAGLTSLAFATMTSVEAPDPATVVVKMSKPWSTFPYALAGQPGYMASPAMLAAPDGDAHPIGTGPFVFATWTPDSKLSVTKNARYWQAGLPHLDAVDFAVLGDGNSRMNSLDSGAIDVLQATTPDLLLSLQAKASSGSLQLMTDAGRENDEIILALNTSAAPFDDPVARQAFATALDQSTLAETSFGGAFPPAWGPLGEGSSAYLSPADAGYPAHDPSRATELAKQYAAAHGQPLSFELLAPSDLEYQKVAQAVQAQAKEVGIDVRLQTTEQAALITTVLNGRYQAAGFALFDSPTMDKAYPFIVTPPAEGLSLNFTRNANPRIVTAMDAARTTTDPAQQVEQYRTVQREMAKDLDKIFLVHKVSGIAASNRVRGLTATVLPGTTTAAQAGSLLVSPFLTTTWIKP